MKWRNQLLALFCLFVFLAFGVFYFQYWVVQKPFGIVLFVAEGLDAKTLAQARLHAGGADKPLAPDSFPYIALLKNQSADSAVPDIAAAASAIATGVRVRNGAVAVGANGQNLASLLDLARDSGRVTGLITDGKITAPTAAAFYGHAQSDASADFAQQLADEGTIDVVLGGGAADFLPEAQGGYRTDERDLLQAIRGSDYEVVQSLAQLEAVPRWRLAKLFGLFSENELAFAHEQKAGGDAPTLSDLVRRGIELLQFHRGGYLLVVDASLMRKARRDRTAEIRLEEVAEFNRAVAVATEYAGKKSAIFVCNDVVDLVEPSLLSPSVPQTPDVLLPLMPANFTATIRLQPGNAPETPQLGFSEAASDSPSLPALSLTLDLSLQVAAAIAPRPEKVPEDVLAFGYGLGADDLRGTEDSTALFQIIRDNL